MVGRKASNEYHEEVRKAFNAGTHFDKGILGVKDGLMPISLALEGISNINRALISNDPQKESRALTYAILGRGPNDATKTLSLVPYEYAEGKTTFIIGFTKSYSYGRFAEQFGYCI